MGEKAVTIVDTNVLVNLATPVVDGRPRAPAGADPLKALLTKNQGESLALQRGRKSQRDLLAHQKSPTSGDGDESDITGTKPRDIAAL